MRPLSTDTSLLLGRVRGGALQQLHLKSSGRLRQRVSESLNQKDCSRKVCCSDWRLFLFPQEMLSGVVVISSKDSVQHQGVSLTMEGTVNLQLSAKSVGVFEAFYNSVKVRASIALCGALRLPCDLLAVSTFMVFTLPALTEHAFVLLLCPASRYLYV